MKKLGLGIASLLTALNIYAQGDVVLDNFEGGLVHNNLTGADVTPAEGIVIQLYASSNGNAGTFLPVSNSIVKVGILADGYFDRGVVRIPATIIGPGAGAFLEIRGWETNYGASYEEAINAPAINGRLSLRGISTVFMVTSTGNPNALPPGVPVVLSALIPVLTLDAPGGPAGPTVTCDPIAAIECAGPGGTTTTTLSVAVGHPTGAALEVFWTVNGVTVLTNEVAATAPPAPTTVQATVTLLLGSNRVEIAVSDGVASPALCSRPVIVTDVSLPAIMCSSNIVAECSGTNGTTVQFEVMATDMCQVVPPVTCTPPSGSAFGPGVTQVSCVAADAAGNTNACSFTVTVRDNAPPTITCADNLTAECSSSGAEVIAYTVTATDLCDTNLTVACLPPSGTEFGIGVTTVNCSASDSANNTNTCSFTVTILDTTPPNITCPQNISIEGTAPTPVEFSVTATDVCDLQPQVICTPASGSTFALGETGVRCVATDAAGNTNDCNFAVNVGGGNLPPTVSCGALPIFECDGPQGLSATVHADVQDANGDAVEVIWRVNGSSVQTNNVPAGGPPTTATVQLVIDLPLGTNLLEVLVSDMQGPPITCSRKPVVLDTMAPAITCLDDRTLQCTGSGGAILEFSTTATDGCDTNPAVTCQPPSGSLFNVGATVVQCAATDSSGNTNSCSFTVTVVDTLPPNITCPQNFTVAGTGPTVVEFAVQATDACEGDASVICTPPSGSTFAVGETAVECVARDTTAHTNRCTFLVTVGGDNLPPTISCAAIPNAECTGPQGAQFTIDAQVEDPDGDALQVIWSVNGVSVQTNDVPAGGPPTTATVQLTYPLPTGSNAVEVSVSDLIGAPTVCSRSAVVVDTVVPTITCLDDRTLQCTGSGGAILEFSTTATDGCDTNPAVTCQPPSGSRFNVGATVVRCAATDSSGNTNSCSFMVTVTDTIPPNITCPQDINVTGSEPTVVEFTAQATDACDGDVSVTCTPPSGSTFAVGQTTVECVANDTTAHTNRCSFFVTVAGGNRVPTVSCPALPTFECNGPQGVSLTLDAQVEDADGDALEVIWRVNGSSVQTNNVPAGGPPTTATVQLALDLPDGTNLVEVAVTDAKSAPVICSRMAVVADSSAPIVTCPANVTAPCAGPNGAAVEFQVVATDLCDTNVTADCQPPSGSNFPSGVTTVTCAASDSAGNANTCSFTVTVRDTVGPSVTCGGNRTADCAGAGGTVVEFVVTATDACDPNPTVTCEPASGSTFPAGITRIMCTASDSSGNSGGCSFTVDVLDTVAPIVTCPANQTVDCAGGSGTPVQFEVTATDACDTNATITCEPPSGSSFPSGVTTVTCAASDSAGNTNTCSFTVTVRDTRGPSVTCGGNRTADCAGPGGTVVEFEVTATDTCDPNPTVTCEPASGSTFPTGTTRIMCTASDSSGNNGGCSFTVNVLDTVPPSLTCSTNQVVDCVTGGGGTPVQFEVSAIDACDTNATVTCEPPSGSSFPSGVTTVTCAASDSAGNTNTCSFTVTVRDTRGPSVTCGGNRTADCAGPGGTVVEFEVTATDTCDPSPTVTCEPASGSTFPTGTTRIMCTASDSSGNNGGCSFTVNVLDTVAPIVTCPTNQIVDCAGGSSGTPVQFEATATDACDTNATITCEPPSGSSFPSGVTTVTCAASDSAGNTNTCSFTVTVRDTRGPSVTCGGNRTADCAGPGGTVVEFEVTATDACDPNPTVTCEPASGSTFPAGITRIMCTASDGAGNSGGCSFTVNVLDTVVPTVTCPANIVVQSPDGSPTNVTFVVTATDGCEGDLTATCNPASGALFALGSTLVTCEAADQATNSGSCTFTVEVRTGEVSDDPGFVLEVSPGNTRNDFSGFVGMTIIVGPAPIVVTEVGRIVAPGNTGTHLVKFVKGDRQDLPGGSAQVFVGDGEPGTFEFAPLAQPVVLEAGKKYYLLSEETRGGDRWYDLNTSVTVVPIAEVIGGAFQGSGFGLSEAGGSGRSFVPPNFRYQQLTIVCPEDGGVYPTLGGLPITVEAGFAPTNIAFFANGTKIGEIPGGTTFTWTNPPPGEFTITVVATDASGRETHAAPVDITLVEDLEGLVRDVQPGTARNDFTGVVGFEFTPNKSLVVETLGRYVLEGNTGDHLVKIVFASDGSDVPGAQVVVQTAGAPAGEFKYEPLVAPVTLLSNVSYYIVTEEQRGGDRFLDANSRITFGPVASTRGAVFAGGGYGWILAGGGAYGVPNLQYNTTGLQTMVCGDGLGATLQLASAAGDTYSIEFSEDGVHWSPLATHTLDEPSVEIRVEDPSPNATRFYRAVLKP